MGSNKLDPSSPLEGEKKKIGHFHFQYMYLLIKTHEQVPQYAVLC